MTRSITTRALERALREGRLTRRDFIARAAALGLSAAGIAAALAACGAGATPTSAPAATAAPTAVPPTAAPKAPGGAATTAPTSAPAAAAPTPAGSPAAAGGGPTKRGGGGTLKILEWQAPTTFNPHLSSGTKDDLICSIVYEALISVDNDANFVPRLAAEIPSKDNGQLAADGKSVTWKLKQGVTWSDGQPFTADDVVFNWEYVTDKATAATDFGTYELVDKVEKLDDSTVKFTFTDPNPAWFRSAQIVLVPKHVFEKDKGAGARNSQNNLNPVGTGPYKSVEFKPGDHVIYAINEHYREPTKPSFDQIEIKGGGDAVSAARAVLQTGDYDYGWNLQVADNILKQLEQGGKGVAMFVNGGGIERDLLNFTDPNKEDPATGQRSSLKFPHPFLTDLKVRQALSLAADRKTVVDALYGRGGEVAVNILYDPAQYRSKNNSWALDLDKANQLLDEAGWKRGADGYREKGGVKMAVLYQTTVNDVRQKTQQIVKDGWEKIGVKTDLKAIDAGVYFSSDAGNPDTDGHFYADVEMYTSSNALDPQSYMRAFVGQYADQKANQWSGGNRSRYQNPDYDKLWTAAKTEIDTAKRAQLFVQMNDIVIQNVVHIPLVNRKSVSGRAKTLQNTNLSEWDSEYWNIANWVRGPA
ncbi:MAG TPA: peptide ABC transporter substrate-binding protein [Thermomicrobiales bacterium]|nr:peptide ABC transporter substrate-binding protein [Thermomicrobiales bacterium]